ncbi:response regulator [Sanguibacter antarcticus]|uniref:LuxR family two component transcriptional regulator n=1 Tax=Sanguibacter antarcticus TaxID=372484 RepID=A0A2A9E9K3_9MICO|nr:response regulator transcription factor [Sanguibacter antarcticus]PFG34870.1 LuxR family two component transcriptional regulator [Sanguibacter antarcticus]
MTPRTEPIRVVLVDDDPLVRAGLRLILGGDKDVHIVGEAPDGAEGVLVVARTQPDVVLMDIRMPRLDGLAATEQVLAAHPSTKVIVLTTFDTDDMVFSALRIGAQGFLLKDTAPEQIVAAVQTVAAGHPMLSPTVTAQLMASVVRDTTGARSQPALERLARLTEREREVAVAVGRGLSNAEIATSLYMSVATVKSHVGRLFAKLQVENRVQVAICVHDAELR